MKNYIIKETSGELTIVQVKPEQESAFLSVYEGRVITYGSSIQEAIIKFGELLKRN